MLYITLCPATLAPEASFSFGERVTSIKNWFSLLAGHRSEECLS